MVFAVVVELFVVCVVWCVSVGGVLLLMLSSVFGVVVVCGCVD